MNALVCIAKNEDNYIQEWIDYHIKLGFNKIFVYANDWQYSNNNLDVVVLRIKGERQQCTAYNHFKHNFGLYFDWAAFLDVDEFLVLKKHENIREFLSDYEDCNAIGINWAMFGNNNQESVVNNEYNVLKRFTMRSKISFDPNKHVKSIVKLPCLKFQHIHSVNSDWVNVKKEKREGSFNEPIDWSIAQINHYFTKSTKEFIEKCNRVRADTGKNRNFEDHKIYLEQNFEEDLYAYNFFMGKICCTS